MECACYFAAKVSASGLTPPHSETSHFVLREGYERGRTRDAVDEALQSLRPASSHSESVTIVPGERDSAKLAALKWR